MEPFPSSQRVCFENLFLGGRETFFNWYDRCLVKCQKHVNLSQLLRFIVLIPFPFSPCV